MQLVHLKKTLYTNLTFWHTGPWFWLEPWHKRGEYKPLPCTIFLCTGKPPGKYLMSTCSYLIAAPWSHFKIDKNSTMGRSWEWEGILNPPSSWNHNFDPNWPSAHLKIRFVQGSSGIRYRAVIESCVGTRVEFAKASDAHNLQLSEAIPDSHWGLK